jgi:hypothetical protein
MGVAAGRIGVYHGDRTGSRVRNALQPNVTVLTRGVLSRGRRPGPVPA